MNFFVPLLQLWKQAGPVSSNDFSSSSARTRTCTHTHTHTLVTTTRQTLTHTHFDGRVGKKYRATHSQKTHGAGAAATSVGQAGSARGGAPAPRRRVLFARAAQRPFLRQKNTRSRRTHAHTIDCFVFFPPVRKVPLPTHDVRARTPPTTHGKHIFRAAANHRFFFFSC